MGAKVSAIVDLISMFCLNQGEAILPPLLYNLITKHAATATIFILRKKKFLLRVANYESFIRLIKTCLVYITMLYTSFP